MVRGRMTEVGEGRPRSAGSAGLLALLELGGRGAPGARWEGASWGEGLHRTTRGEGRGFTVGRGGNPSPATILLCRLGHVTSPV